MYNSLKIRSKSLQNDRMMADMAVELRKQNIAAVSLWPGPVLTESIKDLLAGENGELAAKNVCLIFSKCHFKIVNALPTSPENGLLY